jgi:hypothetical protein
MLTLKKDITPTGMNQEELYAFLANVVEVVTALSANSVLSSPALGGGSNADDIANAAFSFRIAGVVYHKAAITTGTAPGTDVVPQSTYGAVALDIAADGTLDAVSAPANATGYASAALAAAALPAPAAGHIRVGYVTVTKSDGAFTFGTTNFNAANVTAAFTNATQTATAVATSPLKLTAG